MHALKRYRGDGSAQVSVIGGDDVDILGADNDVDGLVFLKAEVDAFELAAEEFDQSVLKHNAVEDVAFADEVRDKCVFRLVIDILGRADLLDAALIHDDDSVGHGKRLLLIVGHIYKSDAHRLLDTLELVLHILAKTQVKSAERLVKQQHLRTVNQCASYGDTLLLTAGQLRYLAVFKALEAYDLEHFRNALVDLLLGKLCKAQSESHVFVHIKVRKQRILLEYRVDLTFVRRDIIDPHAVKKHVAAGGLYKAADDPERGGLAAAGWTQQREEFLIIKIQVNIV